MIITIGGNVGAGKTALSARLAAALAGDSEMFSIGHIMREMAAERSMTIEKFYAELKSDPSLERSIDERQTKLMHEKDNLIVQGRIAWFFAKGSPFKVFNIFLGVSPEIGAERTAQRKENVSMTIDEVRRANAARTENELQRYRTLYNIENFLDPAHYDLVLDTSKLSEDEVLQKIFSEIKKADEKQ